MSKNIKAWKREHRRLTRERWYKAIDREGSNCNNPELWYLFSGDSLPSDERAKELCAGCPLLGKECKAYADTGEMVWGVLDGRVFGRGLMSEGGYEDD